MACCNPITIKISPKLYGRTRYQQVPCGHCYLCIKSYQNSWSVRLFHEMKRWAKVSFVTLTYKNSNIPLVISPDGEEVNTLRKRDVQLWLKRLRKNLGHPNFKYFCCGEYGPSTKRAHYHIIFFGLSQLDLVDSLQDWFKNFGFYQFQDVDHVNIKSALNSSMYVSKYATKGPLMPDKVNIDGVEKPFRLMSKGIGDNYIPSFKQFHQFYNPNNRLDRINDLLDNNTICINGFHYQMPRYYKDKLYGKNTILSYQIGMVSQARADDLLSTKLEQLSTQMPFNEAISKAVLQDIQDKEYKNKEYYEKLAKFYNFRVF